MVIENRAELVSTSKPDKIKKNVEKVQKRTSKGGLARRILKGPAKKASPGSTTPLSSKSPETEEKTSPKVSILEKDPESEFELPASAYRGPSEKAPKHTIQVLIEPFPAIQTRKTTFEEALEV